MLKFLVLATLLFPTLACAKPSGASHDCLNEARAERTWPTRELTTDNDGCWTYWRKGLRHIVVAKDDGRPKTDSVDTLTLVDVVAKPARAAAPEALPVVPVRWEVEERYSVPIVDAPLRVAPRPKQDQPNRQSLLAVIAGIMFLCCIEAACGPQISMAMRTRLAIRKNQLEEDQCLST